MLLCRRSLIAVAACAVAACCGCAGIGNKSAGQPELPGAGVKEATTYEPPVPVNMVPSGELRPDPPTGWAKFNFDHLTETFKTAFGQGPNENIARLYYSQGDD